MDGDSDDVLRTLTGKDTQFSIHRVLTYVEGTLLSPICFNNVTCLGINWFMRTRTTCNMHVCSCVILRYKVNAVPQFCVFY
jgi:hypothetical protein